MAWWLWVLFGFGLVACELLTPGGFFFIFFGLGAVSVGGLVWLGFADSAALQWFLFSLISLVFLVPLRGRLVRWMGAGEAATAASVDALVGQVAVLLDDLPPGQLGKAELRGSSWNARNADQRALRRGERGKVTRVEGLTLWLQAE
jgi:inner membrane protein